MPLISYLPNPKFYAANSDGTPMVGGKLYTYEAGTAELKATYQDYTLLAANTNPVILNARGEASVFLSGAYKLVLFDKDDNQIWTMDYINQAPLNQDWNIEAADVAFLDATHFSVDGDVAGIYIVNRAVKLTQSADDTGYVASSSYSALTAKTTVTVKTGLVVDGGLSQVEYGEDPASAANVAEIVGDLSLVGGLTVIGNVAITGDTGMIGDLDVTGTLDVSDVITAPGGVVGDVTGDVVGDVTGDVTGNADTATDAGVGGSNSSPGGDFTSGTITWFKIGKLITVQFFNLIWASSSSPDSAAGLIPVALRPSGVRYSVSYLDSSEVFRFHILTDGGFGIRVHDWTGALSLATSVFNGSVSYIID